MVTGGEREKDENHSKDAENSEIGKKVQRTQASTARVTTSNAIPSITFITSQLAL